MRRVEKYMFIIENCIDLCKNGCLAHTERLTYQKIKTVINGKIKTVINGKIKTVINGKIKTVINGKIKTVIKVLEAIKTNKINIPNPFINLGCKFCSTFFKSGFLVN